MIGRVPYDHGGPIPGGGRSRAVPAAPPKGSSLDPPDVPPVLDMTFDRDSLYALRSAVKAHAVQAGMPHGRADDVVICVHELATNAIRHGAGTGRARMWGLPGRLRCQVDDDGPPPAGDGTGAPGGPTGRTPPDSADDRDLRGHAGGPDLAALADPWPQRYGHGLWLIRCVADALAVRSDASGGTNAVLTFLLPEPGPRPPFQVTRHSPAGAEQGRSRVTLTATGDLDQKAGADLLAAADLPPAPPAELIVDLLGVAFWDTAGIAALSMLKHRVDQRPPATLRIVAGPGPLRERLGYLDLGDTLADADADPDDRREP